MAVIVVGIICLRNGLALDDLQYSSVFAAAGHTGKAAANPCYKPVPSLARSSLSLRYRSARTSSSTSRSTEEDNCRCAARTAGHSLSP